MVCNRDEKRSRPAAQPPAVHRLPNGAAVWPVDPLSGGTWIGMNDAGVAMVLLNRSAGNIQIPEKAVSRGTIVPRLLRHHDIEDVIGESHTLLFGRYEPFTLLVLHRRATVTITQTNGRMAIERAALLTPLLLTSSSLGDEIVTPPRRALFERLVENSESPVRGQRAFHRHAWPERPEVSVYMRRPDAATVSRTTVDVTPNGASICYTPLPH